MGSWQEEDKRRDSEHKWAENKYDVRVCIAHDEKYDEFEELLSVAV